jgi:hypothetical protein
MTAITYSAMTIADAEVYWRGEPDANGQAPETAISDGDGVPCRHCFKDMEAGERYLILAYRPFPSLQPYAETGPIFLHASPCTSAEDADGIPPMLAKRKAHLVKCCNVENRIVYGTGQIIMSAKLYDAARNTL